MRPLEDFTNQALLERFREGRAEDLRIIEDLIRRRERQHRSIKDTRRHKFTKSYKEALPGVQAIVEDYLQAARLTPVRTRTANPLTDNRGLDTKSYGAGILMSIGSGGLLASHHHVAGGLLIIAGMTAAANMLNPKTHKTYYQRDKDDQGGTITLARTAKTLSLPDWAHEYAHHLTTDLGIKDRKTYGALREGIGRGAQRAAARALAKREQDQGYLRDVIEDDIRELERIYTWRDIPEKKKDPQILFKAEIREDYANMVDIPPGEHALGNVALLIEHEKHGKEAYREPLRLAKALYSSSRASSSKS